jgi:hypothetical protein
MVAVIDWHSRYVQAWRLSNTSTLTSNRSSALRDEPFLTQHGFYLKWPGPWSWLKGPLYSA